MSTRRNFLFLSSAALAWAASSSRLFAQAAQHLGMPVFSNGALGAYQQGLLTQARFESLIGSAFHLYMDNAVVEVFLQKVLVPSQLYTAPPSRAASGVVSTAKIPRLQPPSGKCFMLQFITGSVTVPQDSYVLDHGVIGSFTVLLVPNGKAGPNAKAIATFNYL